MPVDLKQIGPPKQYPARGPGLRVWLVVWVVCVLLVDGAVLLLWPKSTPAQGAWFWLLIAGLPNVVFFALVAWNRAHYESQHLHALYYNDHRERRRRELIAEGQRFLHVLGYTYQLPLKRGAFAQTVAEGESVLKAQPLRDGSTIIRHLRLPDDAEHDTSDPRLAQVLQRSTLAREGKLHAHLLAPLVDMIEALVASGVSPAIRLVITDGEPVESALEQIHIVMGAFHLPAFERKAIPGSGGLMLIDEWLDAKEPRPLLVIATALHDVPPEESTEGGVAMLLVPESLRLPQGVAPCATFYRPVSRLADELGEGIALSMLWGKAAPPAIEHAWVTGFAEDQHTLIGEACRRTDLARLTTYASRYNPDRVVGHAGVAAGWLAAAAASECGAACPQLILNRASAMQAAIVHAHPVKT
jgi:hypothetical protein